MDLKKLMTGTCPFPQVFDNKDKTKDNRPESELAYFRCDYDGYRWWNTVWPVNKALETDDLIDEMDAVYDAFIAAFPTLASLRRYCKEHLITMGSTNTEYNAFLDLGGPGLYWLRLITREKDYNMYLHCYSKQAVEEEDYE